jgi:hypothetical protein
MGSVKTTDRFFCENGSYRYAGRVLHDAHKHGWLTVPEVLKYSSNIGASKISERMDPERYYDTIRSFGFGTKTGIELTGEIGGILPPRGGFKGIRRATVSFGQGISVTPIQMASAMSAVVNGGKVMRPFIVREILDPEGKVVYRGEPKELRRVLSPKTSAQMREMMGLVVQEDGTGTQARIKGFLVGGKTGTAQKVEVGTGRYSPSKRVSSFIGFLPLQDPELMILVVIDEPKGQVYGGVVAAPAFNQIAVTTAYYLGIPPTEPVARAVARREKEAPRGAGVALTRVSTSPAESAMVMPDLRGLSMGRVVDVMGRYSVKLHLAGTGVARLQTPAPGQLLVPGAECTVNFGAVREGMRLSEILSNVPSGETPHGAIDIGGISIDSRKVRKADLFVALRGEHSDGHAFLAQAARAGAAAALVEREISSPPLPTILVASTADALPKAAANFHGDPTARLVVVGITRTNGKTTVTYLLSILSAAGHKTAVISTINYRVVKKFSAPDSPPFPQLRGDGGAASRGVTHVLMEVSCSARREESRACGSTSTRSPAFPATWISTGTWGPISGPRPASSGVRFPPRSGRGSPINADDPSRARLSREFPRR